MVLEEMEILILPVLLAGIWLIARAVTARNQIEELNRRVDNLQSELKQLRHTAAALPRTTDEKSAGFAVTKPPPRMAEATNPPSVPTEKTPDSPPIRTERPIPSRRQPEFPPLTGDHSIGETVMTHSVVPEGARGTAPATPVQTSLGMPPLLPRIPPLPKRAPPSPVEALEPVGESFGTSTRTSASAHEPPIGKEKSSFEMQVGTYWLVRIGIVILVTGLAFGANLAYQTLVPKLGPAGKISLLYFASGLLLGAGAWWQRRNVKEALKNYAQVLFAGGLAAVYFTTYAAHYAPPVCVIPSPLLDGVLLFAWAGVIAWIADRRQSEVMALFAVGLAFFTSVITRGGSFTLYSNLLLTITAVVFLVRNRWVGLSFASLVTSYAGYAFWRFLHEDGWRWANPDEHLWLGASFLAGYWLVFTVATFLSRSEKLSGSRRSAFLTLNNGAYFALFVVTMLQVHTGGFWKFSLGYGVALLSLAALAKNILPAEPLAKNSYLSQGLVLVTLGFITKFAGLQLALLLGAESVVLFVLGSQRRSLVLKCFGAAAAMLATAWCAATAQPFNSSDVLMAVGLGLLLAGNAGWALRVESQAGTPGLHLQSSFFVLLAFASWAMAMWFDTAEPHLLVALVLAMESAVFYNVVGGQKILVPKIAAYASGASAAIWIPEKSAHFDPAGLWTDFGVGAILILNAWRGHWECREIPRRLRPEPSAFTLLAFACWLTATWLNSTADLLPLALATEAVALTFSIYLLRVPEITFLGQSFLLLAQLAWLFRFFNDTPPWWNPLAIIAVTMGLSHWWQHQKTLSLLRMVYASASVIFVLAVVAVTLVWLHPLLSPPAWLAVTSLLAAAGTGYGLATRVWTLAICSQIFLGISACEFLQQRLHEKPEWYFPLAPLAVLAALSFATITWLARKPASSLAVRQPLLQVAMVYRWLALAMSLLWIWDYLPEHHRVWAYTLAAATLFALGVWRDSREALVATAVCMVAALTLLWLREDLVMDIYWPNLLSLLALLVMQRILRGQSARLLLAENIHGSIILLAGVSLWRFLSCWTAQVASGFSVTLTWAAFAVGMFAAGILLHERFLRWFGLSVLAAAVGRVVLVDVWKEQTGYRVLTFLALGAALLVVGFIYNKFQEKIRPWM